MFGRFEHPLQVGVDDSRVCLEKLSGGVDGLIVRLALYCWKDWMGEARRNILDSGVLHLVMSFICASIINHDITKVMGQ
jgi:hypothetical protein